MRYKSVRKCAQYYVSAITLAQCTRLYLFLTLPLSFAPLAGQGPCALYLFKYPFKVLYSTEACTIINDALHPFLLAHQVLGYLGTFPQSVPQDSTVITCVITFKVCHALATVVARYYMSFCVKQATLQRRYMDTSTKTLYLP